MMTIQPNWFSTLMVPPQDAEIQKQCLQRACQAVSSEDSSFVTRHFEPAAHLSLAWVQSFFDSYTFTGKALVDTIITWIDVDMEEALEALKSNFFNALYSVKQLLILPFVIFAGIFYPEAYNEIDQSSIEIESDLAEDVRRLTEELQEKQGIIDQFTERFQNFNGSFNS